MPTSPRTLEVRGNIWQVRAAIERTVGGVRAVWTSRRCQKLEILELERGHTEVNVPKDVPEWVRSTMLEEIRGRIPSRTTWRVKVKPLCSQKVERLAWIEAYEYPDGRVVVDFVDDQTREIGGFTIVGHPIGEAFEELASSIAQALTRDAPSDRDARRGAPHLENRADWSHKLEVLTEYERKVKNGALQNVAADEAGHAVTTLARWAKRRDELGGVRRE